MRIFLLRLLISWWILPLLMIIGLPLMWLLTGEWQKDDARDIIDIFWNGDTL